MKNKEKVYLGMDIKTRNKIYLIKHEWDCNWYWSFGYLGNNFLHFHFDDINPVKSNKHKLIFDIGFSEIELKLENNIDGWQLMELFMQAYALKKAAELFSIGHVGIGDAKGLGLSKDMVLASNLNDKIKMILDNIWNLLAEKKEE